MTDDLAGINLHDDTRLAMVDLLAHRIHDADLAEQVGRIVGMAYTDGLTNGLRYAGTKFDAFRVALGAKP